MKKIILKKLLTWTALAALLMIGGPFLALQFAGWNAMGVCFLLFFAANPLFSAVCGAVAGANTRKLWALPLITAVLFLVGVWLFFEMGEPAFFIYFAGYLLIGALAMLISAVLKKRNNL